MYFMVNGLPNFPSKKKPINDISFARVIFMPFFFNGDPEEVVVVREILKL